MLYWYWGVLFLVMLYFGWSYGTASILVVAFVGALVYAVATDKLGKKGAVVPAAVKPNQVEVDVTLDKAAAAGKDEVFYVSDNQFSYEEAPATCAAYGAKLATYSQVEDAYDHGAEWCGYGWSEDGMALFPTQKKTWKDDYSKDEKHSCGRPGVNGGYFDKAVKFGVNCFGKKPKITPAESQAMKPVKPPNSAFDNMVDKIKGEIDSLKIAPFKKKEWSEYSTPFKQHPSLMQPTKAPADSWAASALGEILSSVDGLATKVGGVMR